MQLIQQYQQSSFQIAMSFFLLQENEIIASVIKNCKREESTIAKDHSATQCLLNNRNIKNMDGQILGQILDQSQIHKNYLLVPIKNIQSNIRIAARLKFNRQTYGLSLAFSIINKEQTFLKIRNIRSLPQLSYKVNNYLNMFNLQFLNISFNVYTGEVVIKLPVYNFNNFFKSIKKQKVSQYLNQQFLQKYIPLIQFIASQGNSQSSPLDYLNKCKTIENIFRYSEMMNISHHFNESRVQMEEEVICKQKMKRESIKRRVNNRIHIQGQFLNTNCRLFQYHNRLDRLIPIQQQDFFLQEEELKYICTKIAMPVQAKLKNPFQNLMVLNFISVQNLFSLRLTKINYGGFSTIYLTDIIYEYVYSSEDHQSMHRNEQSTSDQSQSKKRILHKYVIIKMQDESRSNNRNRHQINILKNIKNGSSMYLPKYYIVVNKSNPFQNAIVMDYIPSKNLHDYMSSNSQSISLLTKLYLIFSIVQALRYIRDYKIVHLDLKPSNVMIFCNMLIKLIDFGQSYHPEVCLKNHRPGYTIPYSSPQIFKKEPHCYTSKSDVFSLGVLMFQMLYKCFPYDIFEQTESIDDVMKEYLKKWYFSSQEYETYGEINVIRILNLIISKCLSPNPSCRPQLDWIALILKQCFDLLY